MSIPKQKGRLLSAMEKERLSNRHLDPSLPKEEVKRLMGIRKRNDLIVKNKLRAWLEDCKDVMFILKHLPVRQIKKMVTDDDAYALLENAIALLDILDFVPVQQASKGENIVILPALASKDDVYPNYSRSIKDPMIRLAYEKDFERNFKIRNYSRRLGSHYYQGIEAIDARGFTPWEKKLFAKYYGLDKNQDVELVDSDKSGGIKVRSKPKQAKDANNDIIDEGSLEDLPAR